MRRIAILILAPILFGTLHAQPPVPTTPAIPATPPAVVAAPTTGEATLGQFDPLNAYPTATQSAVRGAVLASNWLARMNQPQGRFQYGYRPALRQPMEGDRDLAQAQAALALARAARFTANERQATIAAQAILAMLANTRLDPADANCRVPVAPSTACNRVGFAATVALAIFELPGADDKLLAEAERLVAFLHRNLKTDGSVHYIDSPTESSVKVDPSGVNEHPGTALHAIAASMKSNPAAWKTEALKKGLEHYRAHFKANPHPMLAATLSLAFAECHARTNWNDAATAVLEMNDWLIGLQYSAGDAKRPLWAGGFRTSPLADSEPTFECGYYLRGLACGYRMLRANPDLSRAAKYKQALADAVAFQTSLQYVEGNTRHFENGFRANALVGGIYLTPTDGNLRVDATAAGALGLLEFLNCGAEKN